jgi:hypothetical protein
MWWPRHDWLPDSVVAPEPRGAALPGAVRERGPYASPVDQLTMILQTRPTVDGWVFRGRTVEVPEPESELADDDRTWPWRPTSEVARIALLAASEHLQLVGECVERRRLFVGAAHTALRGALLGAAHAVWTLAPQSAKERQQRGLRSATEWYRRMAQADEIQLAVCPEDQLALLQERIEHTRERYGESRALWSATDSLSARGRPTDTDIIDWVARFLFEHELGKRTAMRLQWAEMSGDAHALGWQLLKRRTSPMIPADARLHETAVRSDLDHLAEPYMAAYTILRRGWSFFDQRASDR